MPAMPHNGHVLTRAVKDVFPRYKTMQGFDVPRKAGWDTHGLPVETEVAKDLPARIVVGYVWFDEPPQDFHAIFEAWLGGRWVLFDPTGMAPPERLVRIGTGRDAKDVAFSTIFGAVQMTRKEVKVDERVTGGDALAAAAAPAANDPELRTQVRAELTAEDA